MSVYCCPFRALERVPYLAKGQIQYLHVYPDLEDLRSACGVAPDFVARVIKAASPELLNLACKRKKEGFISCLII